MKKYEIGNENGTVLVDVTEEFSEDFISSTVAFVEFIVERLEGDDRETNLTYPDNEEDIMTAIANIGL